MSCHTLTIETPPLPSTNSQPLNLIQLSTVSLHRQSMCFQASCRWIDVAGAVGCQEKNACRGDVHIARPAFRVIQCDSPPGLPRNHGSTYVDPGMLHKPVAFPPMCLDGIPRAEASRTPRHSAATPKNSWLPGRCPEPTRVISNADFNAHRKKLGVIGGT